MLNTFEEYHLENSYNEDEIGCARGIGFVLACYTVIYFTIKAFTGWQCSTFQYNTWTPTMESHMITYLIILIIWLNIGVRATIDMNEADCDSMEWTSFPIMMKVPYILAAPIMMLVFERWILSSKK